MLFPLADTVVDTSFHSGCCSSAYSREMHPSVERGCPFFAASAGLNPYDVSHSFDDVAQTGFLLDEAAAGVSVLDP